MDSRWMWNGWMVVNIDPCQNVEVLFLFLMFLFVFEEEWERAEEEQREREAKALKLTLYWQQRAWCGAWTHKLGGHDPSPNQMLNWLGHQGPPECGSSWMKLLEAPKFLSRTLRQRHCHTNYKTMLSWQQSELRCCRWSRLNDSSSPIYL